MGKRIAGLVLVAGVLFAAACTTSNVRTATSLPERPPAGAQVVVIQPDVKLSVLTAVGAPERRADWSEAGERNVLTAIQAAVSAKGFRPTVVDPGDDLQGRGGQIVRLHGQVAASIILHHLSGLFTLPSMKDRFDYSLGSGVRDLAGTADAGYAMFVTGEGCFSSGGRMAVVMLAAFANVQLPTCQQQLMVSLVRTDTGQVVWFNYAIAGPADDMREQAGATTLVTNVLRSAPL